jgi:hypothetical protein
MFVGTVGKLVDADTGNDRFVETDLTGQLPPEMIEDWTRYRIAIRDFQPGAECTMSGEYSGDCVYFITDGYGLSVGEHGDRNRGGFGIFSGPNTKIALPFQAKPARAIFVHDTSTETREVSQSGSIGDVVPEVLFPRNKVIAVSASIGWNLPIRPGMNCDHFWIDGGANTLLIKQQEAKAPSFWYIIAGKGELKACPAGERREWAELEIETGSYGFMTKEEQYLIKGREMRLLKVSL